MRLVPHLVTRHSTRPSRIVAVAALLGGLTALAYEVTLHRTLGGVVWVPLPVAGLAVVAAGWRAYRGDGLLACWTVGAGPFLGFQLYWYLFSITHRPLLDRVVDAVLGESVLGMVVLGVVFGTVGFVVGEGVRLWRGVASGPESA